MRPSYVQDHAYQYLADGVLAAHVVVVAFVVIGLVLIILGNILNWRWANALWFRAAHLLAIVIVVAESWLGITCPLTTLEAWLRSKADQASYSGSFIEHWLTQLLFFDAPAWVFTLAYSVFGILVVLSWWKFPPKRQRRDMFP